MACRKADFNQVSYDLMAMFPPFWYNLVGKHHVFLYHTILIPVLVRKDMVESKTCGSKAIAGRADEWWAQGPVCSGDQAQEAVATQVQ